MPEIKKLGGLPEGEFFCRWMYGRLIKHNKNVLGVETGATGSGKSYRDLRKAELWYKYYFKEDFPIKNICFGVGQVMDRIASGELRRGEILIFEEAGVSMGSLDFQSKVAKMFNYILQSFRSMNLALFMNLPYESMLNKTARTLLHYTSESDGIDFARKMNRCKPKFNQVNQSTGKVYHKYRNMRHNGRWSKVKRLYYSMPEKRLILSYEIQKEKYLADLTQDFRLELRKRENEADDRMKRKDLAPQERRVYDLAQEGLLQREIGEKIGTTQSNVSETFKRIKKKGYSVQMPVIA